MTFANLFPVLCFSQSMLMSIEINRNRLHVLRSLWSSIFIDISNLSIDSYWQISSTTDLSTSFPMIDFRSTCDVPKRLNVFNMNKCEPTIYSQLFPSLASFLYRPANQMIKFPPVAETPYELDFTTAITWESENTRSEDSVRHFPLVAFSLSCFSCETYKRPQTEIKLSLYHFSKKFSLYHRTRKSKKNQK